MAGRGMRGRCNTGDRGEDASIVVVVVCNGACRCARLYALILCSLDESSAPQHQSLTFLHNTQSKDVAQIPQQ